MITKKHFKEIAEVINKNLVYDSKGQKAYNHEQVNSFVDDLSVLLKTINPQFDEQRFKQECLK